MIDTIHDPHWGVDVAGLLNREKDPIETLTAKLEEIDRTINALKDRLDREDLPAGEAAEIRSDIELQRALGMDAIWFRDILVSERDEANVAA